MGRVMIYLRSVFDEIVADGISVAIAERKIRKRILELEKRDSMTADPRAKVPLTAMLRYHDEERDRRRRIEEKARAGLLAITLAFSVIFAGLGVMKSQAGGSALTGNWSLVLLVFLIAGVVYLFGAGLAALRAMGIGRVYAMDLGKEVELSTDEEKAGYLLLCLELNQLTTLNRSNYTYVSFKCIRNGVLALAVFILVISFLTF